VGVGIGKAQQGEMDMALFLLTLLKKVASVTALTVFLGN